MTRRPLSPMPAFQDFSEAGRLARLYGQWERLTNQADIVVEVGEREVDFARELGQVAIVRASLDGVQSTDSTPDSFGVPTLP